MKTTQLYRGAVRAITLALVMMIVTSLVASAGTPDAAAAQPFDDVVLEWNLHAVTAFTNPPAAPTPGAGMPPQVAVLHIAIVQGAIYDAVTMIAGGYEPYSAGLPQADSSASKRAAVATAAHRVLVGINIAPAFPQQVIDRLDGLWAASIDSAASLDGPEQVAAGIAVGETAAAAMLAARSGDGRFVPYEIVPGTNPGEWRPAPPSNASDPFAWVAHVEPFMLESTSQFRSKGPNALTSGIYAKEYDEVKTLGGPSGRNARQEAVAQFFTANPVELFNRAFRSVAEDEQLTVAQQARLFAMLNMAGADALINCFNDKAYWNFWRPITAIQMGEFDGNPKTAGDPMWTPMAGTPSYSEHASGYNCVTAAFMHTAEAFFGKGQTSFTLVKAGPNVPEVTRVYSRFTDVITDTIDARVYQGLHFRTSDVQGAEIGKNVARWVSKHYFNRTISGYQNTLFAGA